MKAVSQPMNIDLNSLTPAQVREIRRINTDPIIFAKYCLRSPDIKTGDLLPFVANYPQREIMGSPERNIWICCHRRSGKCLSGESLIIDPTTLRPTPLSVCKPDKTLCFDFKSNSLVWTPCEWVHSGVKQCLKLSLGTGISIDVSTDHQIFDWKRGWLAADQLKVGDRILAPTSIPVFGEELITDSECEEIIHFALLSQTFDAIIYKLSESSLERFLGLFWKATGRLMKDTVTFMIHSKRLCLELHHLLLRIGVESVIEEDGNLFINGNIDCNLFLHKIGIPCQVLDVRSPRRWEIVHGIKKVGVKEVYDLTVEHSDHNFLANDIVVHNSFSMVAMALYYAMTKKNKKILVFAPASTQINEFFDTLDTFKRCSPMVEAAIDLALPNSRDPQIRSFITGSSIKGFITGISANVEDSRRGLTADYVFVDEAQLLSDNDWASIGPIIEGDQYREDDIRAYIAGTIREPVGEFYNKVMKEGAGIDERIVYIPITKNIDFTPEQVEKKKSRTPLHRWNSEWLLEVGEAENSVFRKADVERAAVGDWFYDGSYNPNPSLFRFVGIDWDKVQAGTNIAVVEYNTLDKSIKTLWREEVKHAEHTYITACEKAIEVWMKFNPFMMLVDNGQGGMQFEYLMLEARKRGITLAEPGRLERVALNTKVIVPDIAGTDTVKKPIKPFLVGMLQSKLQTGLWKFPSFDDDLRTQLLSYKIKHRNGDNVVYTSTNEHVIDCHSFVMYGIWKYFEDVLQDQLVKSNFSTLLKNSDIKQSDHKEITNFWEQLNTDRHSAGTDVIRSNFGDFSRGGFSGF